MDAVQTDGIATGPRPVRLLLINPRFPESFWSFRWALDEVLDRKRALNPPLGLATLAALCPPHWEITIRDENVEALPLEPDADLVGVCGMAVQHPRQRELLTFYRQAGYTVLAGGSYASLCPEVLEPLADVVVAGEAEYIWPRFCRDFEAGTHEHLYQENGVVDIADSPAPRFDLLKIDRYTTASLQFSRGCPYRCEFCDIIVMFGRRPRTKAPEQIGRELDALREQGARSVFFVDDNLIGHRSKAMELLEYLCEYQERHGHPFELGTEASLNLAEDDEMLALFRRAGFAWVFLGIETPDPESLREAKKTQNLRGDLLSAVRRLYAHGIDVLGGFIVGFDNDTPRAFEVQERFVNEAGIQVAMVGLLTALPKTPLYARLQREGRLIEETQHGDNTKARTNVIPKGMTYEELIEGYRRLYVRLVEDSAIARRVRMKTRYFNPPVHGNAYGPAESARLFSRLFVRGILAGGPSRVARFLATLATARPRLWPSVVTNWVQALSMRDYVRRHLLADETQARRLAHHVVDFIRRSYARSLRQGEIQVDYDDTRNEPTIVLTVRGRLQRGFYRTVSRRLEKALCSSAANLTLRIETMYTGQRRQIERLLQRLAHHGDRVVVEIDQRLQPYLTIDTSVFRLRLPEAQTR